MSLGPRLTPFDGSGSFRQVDLPSSSQIHAICGKKTPAGSKAAWRTSLRQHNVLTSFGSSERVARALFATVCHSNDAVDAQSAAGELSDYFQTSRPGEQAVRHDSSPNVPHCTAVVT